MLAVLEQNELLLDGGTTGLKGVDRISESTSSTGISSTEWAGSTVAATSSTASDGFGSGRAHWEDGSPAAFAPRAATLLAPEEVEATREDVAETEISGQDAWASQVLNSLKASAPERSNQRLDPDVIMQALGCHGSDCSPMPSRPLMSRNGVPAAGLRRPASAPQVEPEVAAKVQRCRSAVPGLEMSKVRMGDVSDEDTEDEQAFLLSALKPAPEALPLNPKLADVPQLNMLALKRDSAADPAGSSMRNGTCKAAGSSSGSPLAPRLGSLRGSSSQPVLSSFDIARGAAEPAKLAAPSPPLLQSSGAASAALLAGRARRGPMSITVGDWTGTVLTAEQRLAPASCPQGKQLPPVEYPVQRCATETSGAMSPSNFARPDRQARRRPLVSSSLGAATRHETVGAAKRGKSVGASSKGVGMAGQSTRDKKAPVVSHINVHHHLHYHVMRPARSGPVANNASEVLS